MRLILVRHGETKENAKNIAQGHIHGTLTRKGIKQIKLLAEELKKHKIGALYSSDLGRTVRTTESIAKYHKGVKITYTKKLRERNMGIFENKHMKFVVADRERSNLPRHLWRPEKIKEKHKNDTILFVAHGLVNRVIIHMLIGKSLRNAHKTEQKNTCINILESTKNGKFKIKMLNYTGHLK